MQPWSDHVQASLYVGSQDNRQGSRTKMIHSNVIWYLYGELMRPYAEIFNIVCKRSHTHAHTYKQRNRQIHRYTPIQYIRTYVHTHTRTHVHPHVCTYTHMNIHTHTQIYVCMHVHICTSNWYEHSLPVLSL